MKLPCPLPTCPRKVDLPPHEPFLFTFPAIGYCKRMKSYFRYVPYETIGIIASPDCNAIFDHTGKLAFTGGVQGINVWNLRQASLVSHIRLFSHLF
jgi:hypothetical protein